MTRSKATGEQRAKKPGGITGKGFVKGDPRINRKGRPPANSDELNALLDSIFSEVVTDGKTSMTKLQVALNRLLAHKNPAGAIHLLDRRYGKVKELIDLSNSDGSLKPEHLTPSEILARADALRKQVKNDSDGN